MRVVIPKDRPAMPTGMPSLLASRLLPILAVVVAIVSLQGGASVAKQLFPVVGAQGAVSLRLGFASLMLLGFWRPWRTRPDPRTLPWIIGYGAALGCMNLTFYMSLKTVPLGLAVALEFIGPLTVAVLASRRWIDVLWVAMAALGIAMLLVMGPATARIDPLGATFSLAAGVFWGLYIVLGKRAGAANQGHAAAYGAVMAAAIVIPVGVAHAGSLLLSPALLPLGLAVGFLTSALPYSLEIVAMSRMPARTFGVLMSLEPAIGALSGFLFLHERLVPLQLLAVALIMAASAGVVLEQRRD
jgi:inner membrane transporter RhtA